jgi:transcriptional regulator with XRE-family HTH domain
LNKLLSKEVISLPEAVKQELEAHKLSYVIAIKRSKYGTSRRIAEELGVSETEVSRAVAGAPEPRYERIRKWLEQELKMEV